MKHGLLDRILSLGVLLPFVAAVWFLYSEKGVAYDTFVFGSGSWGIGCILKIVGYRWGIARLRHDPTHIFGTSALNGLYSGVTELGAAFAMFMFMPSLTLWDVIGFGVGIGTIEAFVAGTNDSSKLMKGTKLEGAAGDLESVARQLPRGKRLLYTHLVPIMERLIAGVIHIGTRGLVYVAYKLGNPVPFLVAVSAFVIVDGVVGYRWFYQGKLNEIRILNRAYAIFALVGGAVLVGFLFYWPEGGMQALGTLRSR